MTADFPHTIADLGPGDHLCCIYETEEEHRAVLTPFLREGLERGEKVVYIVDACTAETILGYLQDSGLDVKPYLVRGQLAILTRDDTYVREGVFDPDGMIALLRAEMERALAEGYPALRITGEMTWALRGLPGSERLIEYEARLNEFFPGSQCAGLCQYDRRCFDPVVLLDVLRTHPIVILGTDVYDNFYYIPPAELLGGDLSPVMLRRWLENLAERKRAEEQLQEVRDGLEKQNTRLKTLCHIGQMVNSTLEPDDILDRLTDEAMRVTRATHGQVLVAWPESGCFGRRSLRGFSPEEAERAQTVPLPLGQGINGRAYTTRQTVRVDDVQTEPDYFPLIPTTCTELAVPIVREGLVLGNIDLQSPEVGAFRDVDLGYLNALADQVAGALANARLYQAEQCSREMAEALQETVRVVNTSLNLDKVLPLILEQLAQVIEYDSSAVLLLNDGRFKVPAGRGFPDTKAALRLSFSADEHTLSSAVMRARRPLIIEDVQSDPRWQTSPETAHIHAWIGAPLIVRDEVIGVLTVDSRRPGAYSQEDGQLVFIFANHAAVAIQNARLYEQAREEIAERKRAEEALKESKRQLESSERFISRIVESIPSSLLVIDRSLRVVSANRNFLEKTRREAQTTIGYKIEEVLPQVLLDYTRLKQKVKSIFRTGEAIEGEKVAYRAPGMPTRIYYYRLVPLRAEQTVENVMLLMDDVTEREQLGEEVRRAERHLASVVDSAYDLVVSMDAEGRILTWNKAAEQTSGFDIEEVKGQYLPSLCSEEDQQKMGSWLAELTKGRFTKKSMEINLRAKRGREAPISWACSRMLDDERRIVGLVAVGRDLTERKRLEAQLVTSAKLTSLGVMAGGIAHEIRNPLAISSAAAQLLLERPDDEKLRKEAAEKIYSGVQRASYIIENLLKFARPPEERMMPMDISEALEETLSLLTNQIRVQRVELRKDFAPNLPPVVGNKSLLQQVFSNMILNACNAMPDGGSLTITTRVNPANQVEIGFTDTGHGVPKESLSAIFDPFFTTMPVGKGTGLGLSISYSIIKQHQGTIDVESKVGMGSTFTVRLPA
ncbi:MAG: MEDS domain-containing protein, partial [Chloroflexi bacterium]|nr:MEDS domain-containing protein [Chloroflexota bacterium]